MRFILLLLLTGCASTTVYYPNGSVAFKTQGDFSGLNFSGPGIAFHADTVSHSIPTLAGGAAAAGDINAAAGAAAVIGSTVIGGLAVTHSPITAVTAPAATGAVTNAASALNNQPAKTKAISDAAVQQQRK